MPKFKIIAVHGLKGGVGKSTVTVAIAKLLSSRGVRVGLLDADVDSPFLAEILGLKNKITLTPDRQMIPIQAHGMQVMSFAAYAQDASRGTTMPGSMHSRWITDAITHTDWGNIDALIVDLPAGSSDAFLSINRVCGENFLGLIVVGLSNLTTSLDRVWNAAAFHGIHILGLIENLSGPVFGTGGVRDWATTRKAKFFGSVPMDPRVRANHERHEPLLPGDLMAPIMAAAGTIQRMLGKEVLVE